MSVEIPQDILDSLTRVKMPSGASERQVNQVIDIAGHKVPVYTTSSLVLGSGAAGLRAAVELKRKGVDVTVATSAMFGGTSACSGSDKQTLHTAGTSNRGDDFVQLGQDISSGGAMDKDTAYIEGADSLRAFSSLQYMGLPLPQDRFGAVLRYQTDHDEVGRATSCGPRTSRLMVKVLCEEAIRLGVDFMKGTTGIQILKEERDGELKSSGLIAIKRTDETNEFGLIVILCDKLVLATGGPGELYRDSVYPKNCFGSLGMALEAGIEAVNLTESQFGIGTRRTEFPWNLSGTYVQVLPYIYSLDKEGNEHNFLADYYRTTQELVSNVFRKGYQWPFHATRMLDYGSSLVDLAIFIESSKGHTIFMDFNRNPQMVPGENEFSLKRLDDDVRTYLVNNEALQDLPIDRLRRMNPLAIELYKMHGHDISEKPLPFNVSNQHMNGGVEVDIWAQSSLKACYAIGEVSGTHGVTRPGGAALNAGQVFGTRCADHIASVGASTPETSEIKTQENTIAAVLAELTNAVGNEKQPSTDEVRDIIQNRMSDNAGFICDKDNALKALLDTQTFNRKLEKGLSIKTSRHAASYFQWRQTALSAEAVLNCLNRYINSDGGSRGARALCSKHGSEIPETRMGKLNEYRFIAEKDEHKSEKIIIKLDPKTNDFVTCTKDIREMEDPGSIFFEKNWGNYLTEKIYDKGFKHR
ncbi:FAD-binding protein [Lentisphaera profundi]|uniref:FAD-binding protein n=1 Tax=Lentisphaera profundi TaxID=1658616 RepID=A0ABY7VSK5_9BACT|nr:FAD-binding protein [Lentisphaera profundi]WDE96233.1 FAD-binding protein [Lentisphaera profundi]